MAKVAILCAGAGYVFRGVETWAYELHSRLKKRGHEVEVFGQGEAGWVTRVESRWRLDDPLMQAYDRFMRTTRIQGALLRLGIPWFPMSMYHVVDKAFFLGVMDHMLKHGKKFDVILNPSTQGAALYKPFLQKIGAKHISILQGFVEARGEASYLKRHPPDAAVVLTPQAYNELKTRIGFSGRIDIIPNGVDVAKLSSAKPSTALENLPRPIVLSTSALVPFKRIPLLVKAMQRWGKGSLVVAGDGPDRDAVARLGSKLRSFRYLGTVPYSEIASLYAACDIFCLPSMNEAFGNVLVEAMAANKPVVSQEDENRKWIIGEAGVLANLEDINEFAAALEKASTTEWGDKPRRQAEKFNWDNIAGSYDALIKGLA